MPRKTVVLLSAFVLLLGATNSSHSVFRLEFRHKPAPSQALLAAARAALQGEGFQPAGNAGENELQQGGAAVWVRLESGGPGELGLVFSQLRGGCGHYPEVAGARQAVERVRPVLEAQFGPADVSESNQANTGLVP